MVFSAIGSSLPLRMCQGTMRTNHSPSRVGPKAWFLVAQASFASKLFWQLGKVSQLPMLPFSFCPLLFVPSAGSNLASDLWAHHYVLRFSLSSLMFGDALGLCPPKPQLQHHFLPLRAVNEENNNAPAETMAPSHCRRRRMADLHMVVPIC